MRTQLIMRYLISGLFLLNIIPFGPDWISKMWVMKIEIIYLFITPVTCFFIKEFEDISYIFHKRIRRNTLFFPFFYHV